MQLPALIRPVMLLIRSAGAIPVGVRAFEIQWPPSGDPIDPSPQALPDSQFAMLPVHNTLNQPSNPKLISGSRRTGSIGELEVPGDHQIPAVPRSPTPSTRPKDPYLVYNQPGHQKKPTNESFPTPPSPSRVLENSSSTTIPTTQAAAACGFLGLPFRSI